MALWARRDLYRSAGIGGQGIVYQFLAALTASHRSDTHTALLASIRRHGTPLVGVVLQRLVALRSNLSRPTTRVNRHIERSDHRRARRVTPPVEAQRADPPVQPAEREATGGDARRSEDGEAGREDPRTLAKMGVVLGEGDVHPFGMRVDIGAHPQ